MTHDIGAIIEALEQYTRGDDHQRAIDAAVEVLRAVESRESAPIADVQRYRYLRDIKRRDCLTLTGPDAGVWCDAEDEDRNLMLLTEDDLDQAIDAAMQKERKWDAGLAAPAMEGGGVMDTKKIRDAATTLDAERASLNAMRETLATLEFRNGQTMAKISINGASFDLATMGRESGWMPYAIKSTEAIRAEAIRLVNVRIAAQQSKVEGAEWALRQVTKATP